jgi:hypothetical protein
MNFATIFLRGDNKQLKEALNESEKVVAQFGEKVGGTLKTLFAVYVASRVQGFMKDAFHAFSEEDLGIAKLQQSIKNSGEPFDVLNDKIEKLAVSIQRLTRFGDDQTREAARMAINMGVTSDKIEEQVKLAADLAEHLGTTLPGAMQMLTRMAAYPQMAFRMLRQTGIEFTQAEQAQIKELIKTGQTMEATALITEKLKQKVGGLAEEIGNRAAGKIAKMSNELGDFKENLGKMLAQLNERTGASEKLLGIAKLGNELAGGGSSANTLSTPTPDPETIGESERALRKLNAEIGTMRSEMRALVSTMPTAAEMLLPWNTVTGFMTGGRVQELKEQVDKLVAQRDRLAAEFAETDLERDIVTPWTTMSENLRDNLADLGAQMQSAFKTIPDLAAKTSGDFSMAVSRKSKEQFKKDLEAFLGGVKTARMTFDEESAKLEKFKDKLTDDQYRLQRAKIQKDFEEAKKSEDELLKRSPIKKGFTSAIEDIMSANNRIAAAAASMPDTVDRQVEAIKKVEKAIAPVSSISDNTRMTKEGIDKIVESLPLVGVLA